MRKSSSSFLRRVARVPPRRAAWARNYSAEGSLERADSASTVEITRPEPWKWRIARLRVNGVVFGILAVLITAISFVAPIAGAVVAGISLTIAGAGLRSVRVIAEWEKAKGVVLLRAVNGPRPRPSAPGQVIAADTSAPAADETASTPSADHGPYLRPPAVP
jgi:hypothetical protein